ncbi:MAG: class I SAM-dependent methyltransferase [Polyangiales bacterium]
MFDPTRGSVRCSACRRGHLALPSQADGEARCDACAATFRVDDGIVDLIADGHTARSRGQALMEWAPLVRIYESRLWRRSVAATAFLGISFERERELILRELAPTGAMRVLDLACGSGIYSRALARAIPEGQVVALDLSRAMLAYAVRRARREGIRNVLWVRGDAMALPFDDTSIHAVNCCGALHLFPDASRALAEIHRVLRVGGRFTAAVARRSRGPTSDVAAAIAAQLGIASWTEAELRQRLIDAGFVDAECAHARHAWMLWTARKNAQQATEAQGAIGEPRARLPTPTPR